MKANTITIAPIARRYRVKVPTTIGKVHCLFQTVRKLERAIVRNINRIERARTNAASARGILEELDARAELAKHLAVQARAYADLAALDRWANAHDESIRALEAMLHSTNATPPTKSNGTPQSPLERLMPEITTFIQEGRTIHAIKRYREATGVSLHTAKEAVERIAADMTSGM